MNLKVQQEIMEKEGSTSATLSGFSRLAWLAILGFVLVLTGCRVVNDVANVPVKAVTAVVPGSKAKPIDFAVLQVEVERYADDYSSRTVAALDEYARLVGTSEAQRQALRLKINVGTSALSIASGPNPVGNMLEFLAQATITRTALENYWVHTTNGAAMQPWLQASRKLETNAWTLVETVLTPSQQQEARETTRRWADENANADRNLILRPNEFSSLIRQSSGTTGKASSLFGLVGLDFTQGLEPAVQQVMLTRLFAERAMYVIERMPFLLRWQMELMTDNILGSARATEVVGSMDRLSRAAESASRTAAELPDRITEERKAILAALEAQEGKLRDLSAQVTQTLDAGEKMSASLNTTLITFNALMKRFGVGEPSPTNAPPDTNSPPFNILDYATTADQIARMAKELDLLIRDATNTVDSSALTSRINELGAVTDRARSDAKSVLNHAFLLSAGLVVLSFVCALAYRRLSSRAKP